MLTCHQGHDNYWDERLVERELPQLYCSEGKVNIPSSFPSSLQLTDLNQSKVTGGAEKGMAQVAIYGPDFHGLPERKQETLAVQP